MEQIKLGLPKGSLQDSTFALMKKAGWNFKVGSRSYVPSVDDPTIAARLIRPQEIARYVELGLLDAGLTGYDWIYENGADVVEVAPQYDANHNTAHVGAQILFEILSLMVYSPAIKPR